MEIKVAYIVEHAESIVSDAELYRWLKPKVVEDFRKNGQKVIDFVIVDASIDREKGIDVLNAKIKLTMVEGYLKLL